MKEKAVAFVRKFMDAIKEFCQYFDDDRLRVLLFLLSCAAVLFWWKDDQASRLRRFVVWPAVLLVLLFLNPVVAPRLLQASDTNQSLRFFWMIPVTLLISVCIVKAAGTLRNRKWLLLAVPVALVGVLVYTHRFERLRGEWQRTTENWYKVPPVVIELCDRIMEDDAGLEKTAVFPLPLSLWVRQYQPGIDTLYSWSKDTTYSPEQKELFFRFRPEEEAKYYKEEYDGTPVDLEQAGALAAELQYNYIVLPADNDYTGTLEACGYEEIDRVNTDKDVIYNSYDEEYILYRLQKTPEEVTQK